MKTLILVSFAIMKSKLNNNVHPNKKMTHCSWICRLVLVVISAVRLNVRQ